MPLSVRKFSGKTAAVIISFVILIIFCANSDASVITSQKVMYVTPDEAPKALYSGGKTRIAFYDTKGWLKLLSEGDAEPQAVSQQAHPDVKNSSIGLFERDRNIYLTWRPKVATSTADERRGNKHVLFSASYDGGKGFAAPVQLDNGGGAFHPEKLQFGEGGLIYAVWLDERVGKYRVYFNKSGDYGRTWLKEDMQMNKVDGNVYEPFMSFYKNHVWVGWLYQEGGTVRMIKFRHSEDSGDTWSEEAKFPVEGKIFNPLFLKNEKLFALLFYSVDEGIKLSVSKDNGATWEAPSILPGTEETGSNGFKIVENKRGDICVMWPGPQKLKGRKADIYVNCSNDSGASWNKTVRMDTNTPMLTHSLAPDIAMDESGRVVVVWQDTRDIRPHIYMNYSLDGGKKWLEHDIRVNDSQRDAISQFPSVAADGEGRFLIAWQSAESDAVKDREYLLAYEEIVFECSDNDAPKYSKLCRGGFFERLFKKEKKMECPKFLYQPSRNLCRQEDEPWLAVADFRKKKLLSRTKELWKARVNGNFGKAYDMFDPFARSSLAKKDYLSRVGQIKYISFEILEKELSIAENTATVKVKAAFEAETFTVGSYEGSIPRTERVFELKWVWIDDAWYNVYEASADSDMLPKL